MTQEEIDARKKFFIDLYDQFQNLANNNGLKGKAKQSAGFYYMHGAMQAQGKETVDPVFFFSLLRNDIENLVDWTKSEVDVKKGT